MEVKEVYCSFEVSKLLKIAGFKEKVRALWIGGIHPYLSASNIKEEDYNSMGVELVSAPTHQMALAWLREVHNLHCDIDPSEGDWKPNIIELENWSCVDDGNIPICDTYEEAVEEALKYALKNLI